jgi:hypothetical protein
MCNSKSIEPLVQLSLTVVGSAVPICVMIYTHIYIFNINKIIDIILIIANTVTGVIIEFCLFVFDDVVVVGVGATDLVVVEGDVTSEPLLFISVVLF